MASSTLFGYTLEEKDGNLVITIHGAFAETVTKYLKEEMSAGRGMALIQRLSPLGPLRGMLARRGAEEAEEELLGLSDTEKELGADEIMNQGVDQSMDAFEQEMKRFRAAMAAPVVEAQAAEAAPETAVRPARKTKGK